MRANVVRAQPMLAEPSVGDAVRFSALAVAGLCCTRCFFIAAECGALLHRRPPRAGSCGAL